MLRDTPARIAFASSRRLVITIPDEMEGGRVPVLLGDRTIGQITIGSVWATGLHQVDNPIFDRAGNLFVTYSGSRGQESPVSIFRVTPEGTREPFSSGIVNATSMAIGPDTRLYVSSRFEGAVYRVAADGTPEQVAADHLAMSPEGELHVTAPTLGTYDPIYKINRRGQITTIASSLGRPQGLAFGADGRLYVIDALAGSSGLHRLEPDGAFTPVVAGGTLVGVAFGPAGELVVTSNETA